MILTKEDSLTGEQSLKFSANKLPLELIKTRDGSHSLYNTDLEETYHSVHGALNESLHVFIKHGLYEASESIKEISILEIGFGTGLNALLTLLEVQKNKLRVNYFSVEPFPLSKDILGKLNYSFLLREGNDRLFNLIHESDWNKKNEIIPGFNLTKFNSTLQEFNFEKSVDLVYFDAFAPNDQPELWTIDIFEKLYGIMSVNAILVTYCAKGEVKRTLKNAGFMVETLQGPPGKREMVRARKN